MSDIPDLPMVTVYGTQTPQNNDPLGGYFGDIGRSYGNNDRGYGQLGVDGSGAGAPDGGAGGTFQYMADGTLLRGGIPVDPNDPYGPPLGVAQSYGLNDPNATNAGALTRTQDSQSQDPQLYGTDPNYDPSSYDTTAAHNPNYDLSVQHPWLSKGADFLGGLLSSAALGPLGSLANLGAPHLGSTIVNSLVNNAAAGYTGNSANTSDPNGYAGNSSYPVGNYGGGSDLSTLTDSIGRGIADTSGGDGSTNSTSSGGEAVNNTAGTYAPASAYHAFTGDYNHYGEGPEHKFFASGGLAINRPQILGVLAMMNRRLQGG